VLVLVLVLERNSVRDTITNHDNERGNVSVVLVLVLVLVREYAIDSITSHDYESR
jgi:hypothetical protein